MVRLWDDFIRKRVTAQFSVHGYHKRLKPYIVEAIQFGKLETNPYDTVKIKKNNVFKQDDELCIRDQRIKTGQPYTIVLLPKAVEILERYDYNLNLMSNQKCNDQLKLIANMAKIHLNLTMHLARHIESSLSLNLNSLQRFVS